MATQRKTVRVVEDDGFTLNNLVGEPRDQGYRVIHAPDGMAALELYLAKTPDLVLSNIQMPNMNRFQLLRAVRRLDPEMPFIFTTGFLNCKGVLADKIARADDDFEKPINLERMFDCIAGLLESSNRNIGK